MSGIQNKPIRASSARAPAIRPQSSKNRKLHQKTQFIQNIYMTNNVNNALNSFQSLKKNKHIFNKYNGVQNQIQDISKLMPRGQQMNKERQQLFEQNLHLKKQLNRMKDQIMKSRTKIQNLTIKNNKYTKQFNRQFQKKLYWNGNNNNNSYMISGVKAQYQKLREQYNEKQQLCQALKHQLIQSRAPEYKIYAQTLQEQNKKLNERINKMAEVSQNILFDNQQKNKSYNNFLYEELENKLQKIDEKYKQSQINVKIYKQECKDLEKKIEFLQKLIIQKDNAQYHAIKKCKKLQRQRNLLDDKIRQLQLIESQISKNYQIKLQKLKNIEEKRFKTQKDIFDRTIQQKDIKIHKLQKEVAYLSTLLTYWKPLDQLNRESNQRFSFQKQENQSYIRNQQDKKKKNDDSFVLDQKNLGSSTRVRKGTQFQPKAELILKNSVQISRQSNKFEKIKVRVQQTAQKKHNQNAQKKRRVDYKQVQHLGEHLRYRFLGLRLHISQIRKYFDYGNNSTNPQINFVLQTDPKVQKQENEQKWQQQYITMKQVKDILKLPPFELLQQQAHILARYMIQDTTNQFVYVDLNNQHKRSVVKSILKALVGDYQILDEEKQLKVEKQCRQMLDKYQSNLLAALSTMASSGYISRKKFIQLINSLGIELSEEGRDLLVCKMLLKSQNLNKLSYMIILE